MPCRVKIFEEEPVAPMGPAQFPPVPCAGAFTLLTSTLKVRADPRSSAIRLKTSAQASMRGRLNERAGPMVLIAEGHVRLEHIREAYRGAARTYTARAPSMGGSFLPGDLDDACPSLAVN
jgi:hypothetical protein